MAMSIDELNSEVLRLKRVIAVARSNLDANQETISMKDKQIAHLAALLEDEKNHHSRKSSIKDEESSMTPRNFLRRVDVDDIIWILIEYEECDDNWKSFESEEDLDEFIQRSVGIPLVKPPRLLSSLESAKIESDSKKAVDKITEEFRRYKVRTDISLKQKEAEVKQLIARAVPSGDHLGRSADIPRSPSSNNEQIEQESKWKLAYEMAMRENEQLKTRNEEGILINQWKERCEQLGRENETLKDRIKSLESMVSIGSANINISSASSSNAISSTSSSVSVAGMSNPKTFSTRNLSSNNTSNNNNTNSDINSGINNNTSYNNNSNQKAIELAYLELREEFKEYKRKVHLSKHGNGEIGDKRSHHHQQQHHQQQQQHQDEPFSLTSIPMPPVESSGTQLNIYESKIQYIRQMIFQVLCCRDPEVRQHIESALMTLFRFTDQEKLAIDLRRKDESQDPLSSITNYLGSFTVSS